MSGILKRGGGTYRITDEAAQEIIQRAMSDGWLFYLSASAWGNRKKLSEDLKASRFGDDTAAIRAVQDCLDRRGINEITAPQRRAREKIKESSHPWLMPGVYFVRDSRLRECIDFVEYCMQDSDAAVERYVAYNDKIGMSMYERDQLEFKRKHKVLYDHVVATGGYPTPGELREKFRMWYSVYRITPPGAVDGVTAGLGVMTQDEADREKAKWREQLKQVAEYTIEQTRNAFAQIIKHLAETLSDPSKTFQETTVEKPKQFIAEFKEMNLWGDRPFEELAEKADKLLNGVYADDLRSDEDYRSTIGKAVGSIVKEFENLPTVEMERALDF